MKRTMIVILLSLLILASCATPRTNPDGSPYWTTHSPNNTKTMHYEVASAKQSTPQLSQLRAESAAKDAIGRWASTNVDNALVTFIEEAGEALKTMQMLEVLQNLSIQTVAISLRGVTFDERYTAPDGTVWVLASYPVKNLKDAYKQQAVELEQRIALAEAKAIQAEAMLAFLDAELALGIEE